MKGVVFDWNGTLLADSLICWRATNVTLQKLGKPRVSLGDYREKWSVPVMNMYRAFGCSEDELSDDVVSDWFSLYRKGSAGARLRRGARAALGALEAQGVARVVLSNYVVGEIDAHMDRLGIRGSFERILANDAADTAMKKGKVGRLEAFLDEHPSFRGMIVGDTVEEIEIGRAHGLASVALTGGVCSSARLRAAKPDYLIGALSEIPELAGKVFSN